MSYNIYRSLLASRFLTDPCFIRKITIFICQYWCSVFCCAKITCDWYPHRLSPSVIRLSSTRTYGFHFLRSCPAHHSNSRDDWGGGGVGWDGQELVKLCGRLRKIILVQNLLRQSQTETQLSVGIALPQRTW